MANTSFIRSLILSLLGFTVTLPSIAGTYTKHELKIGDVTREYRFYRPAKVNRDQPAKAIIAFHGFMSDPNGLRWLTKMDQHADKHGFAIVYPKAIKGSFNAGRGSGSKPSEVDEEAFAEALLGTLPERHNLDPSRIYTMGFSNGAQMSALMLCSFTEKIAAAAIVSHSINIDDCAPQVPIPTIIIQGAKDPYVPFGGGGKHNLTSHKASVALLNKINKGPKEGKIIVDKASIRCRAYGELVRSCVGFNDGHTWPGGVPFKPEQFGKTNNELIANTFIMSFFEKHKRTISSAPSTAAKPAPTQQAKTVRPTAQPAIPSAKAKTNKPSSSIDKSFLAYPTPRKALARNYVEEDLVFDHEPDTRDRDEMQRGIYPKVP